MVGTGFAAIGPPAANIHNRIAIGTIDSAMVAKTIPIGMSRSVSGTLICPPTARARDAASADVTPPIIGPRILSRVHTAAMPIVARPDETHLFAKDRADDIADLSGRGNVPGGEQRQQHAIAQQHPRQHRKARSEPDQVADADQRERQCRRNAGRANPDAQETGRLRRDQPGRGDRSEQRRSDRPGDDGGKAALAFLGPRNCWRRPPAAPLQPRRLRDRAGRIPRRARGAAAPNTLRPAPRRPRSTPRSSSRESPSTSRP